MAIRRSRRPRSVRLEAGTATHTGRIRTSNQDAVGMVDDLRIMVAAVVIAIGIMLVAAGPVSTFVEAHRTVKMLALSFLLLIGMALVADGLGFHIPKGYIYFAMGFSVFVEFLNLQVRGRQDTR